MTTYPTPIETLDRCYGLGWHDSSARKSHQNKIEGSDVGPSDGRQKAYDCGFADALEHRNYAFRRANYAA